MRTLGNEEFVVCLSCVSAYSEMIPKHEGSAEMARCSHKHCSDQDCPAQESATRPAPLVPGRECSGEDGPASSRCAEPAMQGECRRTTQPSPTPRIQPTEECRRHRAD